MNLSNVQIIQVRSSDWETYRDVRLRSLRDAPDAFGSTYASESTRTDDQWRSRLDFPPGEVDHPVFALLNQQVVGLAWGRIDSDSDFLGHVYQMWVDPTARGKGAGKALLSAVIAWFQGRGVAKVELTVTCGNAAARELYERMGFRACGDPEPLRPGSELFLQSMVLELSSSAAERDAPAGT